MTERLVLGSSVKDGNLEYLKTLNENSVILEFPDTDQLQSWVDEINGDSTDFKYYEKWDTVQRSIDWKLLCKNVT